MLVAVALTARVALLSDGATARLLVVVGVAGAVTLAIGARSGSASLIGAGLALVGVTYGLHLVLDDAPADARAAVVGAGLLAAGELAFWSAELGVDRSSEPGRIARRLGFELVLVLGGLTLAALILGSADALDLGGIGSELVGAAAAVALLGLAVFVLRPARSERDP